MVPVTPYYVEEPSPSPSYMDQPNDYGYDGSDHMVSVNAHTLMLMANGAFRQPGGYNNNQRTPQNQNRATVAGPCFRCQQDHWIKDCPIDKEEKAQARAAAVEIGLEYQGIVLSVG